MQQYIIFEFFPYLIFQPQSCNKTRDVHFSFSSLIPHYIFCSQDKDPEIMKGYFNTMEELASKRNSHALSSRVRFMLQDVIDLRRNKWVPRRNENRPKTIQQIAYEAETEKFGMNSMSKKLDLKPLEADRKAAFQAAQKDWKPHTPQYKTNFVIDKTKLMMRVIFLYISKAILNLLLTCKNVLFNGQNVPFQQ